MEDLCVVPPLITSPEECETACKSFEEARIHDRVLATIRLLVADLCQQHDGGHAGSAMGMAAIGTALWKYTMRYAPKTPGFINRDRFVLSNGHACLLQYIFLHLSGYDAMTMDQLRSYGSGRLDKLCHGHPEIDVEGIEVTTGLLGQGIANSVGLAVATKHLAADFNKPEHRLISNHTWCVCGDACLQEGVALEAISLAGHLGLNNLTLIYDNNQVTCDGPVDIANTEDVQAKMKASGWEVLQVANGSTDVLSIAKALRTARLSGQKPTFVVVNTVIGFGSDLAGTAKAHSVAFGEDQIKAMKLSYGFAPDASYVVPEDVKEFFSDVPKKGSECVQAWNKDLDAFRSEYPDEAARLNSRLSGNLRPDWKRMIPQKLPTEPVSLRQSSSLVFKYLGAAISNFMVGSADVSPSANLTWDVAEGFKRFGIPSPQDDSSDYSGRYIHYGIREHAMVAVANGMAAFGPGIIIPVTSSFLIFYTYAVAAIRMGALQELQLIHVGSHDSIGIGKDGPTHQPIELAALFRAMPNLLYIRPADNEETAGAWSAAIDSKTTPTIISTSRVVVPQLRPFTSRHGVTRGAYVLKDMDQADVTIIGVGAELHMAVEVASGLCDRGHNSRVVSFPCQRLFEKQSADYKQRVLQRRGARVSPVVVIEPYVSNGWDRYADAGICMGTHRFGKSLPTREVYEYFGFEVQAMVEKIAAYLDRLGKKQERLGQFVELNESDQS